MNEDYRMKNKYYPILVFTKEFSESDEFNEFNRKYHSLPNKTRKILGSDHLVDYVYGIEKKYFLQDRDTILFSKLIKEYFFREITEQGFAQKVSQLCRISAEEAMKILRAIVSIDPEEDDNAAQEMEKDIVAIPFNEALSKYPKIKDQKITSRSITARPFLQPLKPTVKNWIMVYEKILGVSRHNEIERGEFVFRSEATRGLSEEERNVLAILFKSRDEGTKIAIDVNTNEIDFSVDGESVDESSHQKKQHTQIISDLAPNQRMGRNNAQGAQITIPHSQEYEKRNISAGEMSVKTVKKPPVTQNAPQKKSSHIDPRRNPTFAALQEEIAKNRAEMNAGDGEKILPSQIKTDQKPPKENVHQKKGDKDVNISFSSKHTLPVEKEVDTSAHVAQNRLNMKPIGFAHDTSSQKGAKKKTV
jgi:hypothetical protein